MSRHAKHPKSHPPDEADRIARQIARERAPWPAEQLRLYAARIVSAAIPQERQRDEFRREMLLYT